MTLRELHFISFISWSFCLFVFFQVEQLNLLSDSNKLLREQKNKLDQLLETTQSRVQELEGEIQPLKESVKSLTVQKDALVAEKTALKNEVRMHYCVEHIAEKLRNVCLCAGCQMECSYYSVDRAVQSGRP